MRKFFGGFFLVAALGVLGIYAQLTYAVGIENTLQQRAQVAAPMGINVTVSGRYVALSGRVQDGAALADLVAAFDVLDGRRVIDVSGVSILPLADPFAIIASRDLDGAVSLSGVIPPEDARALLGQTVDTNDLTLAAGAPDDAWTQAARTGLDALAQLKMGEFVLSDRSLRLTGLARDPVNEAAVRATLDGLPDGYDAIVGLDLEDDGAPLRLSVDIAETGIILAGKVPSSFDMARTFATVDVSDVTQSSLPAPSPDWAAAAGIAFDVAVAHLKDGNLAIEGTQISVTGTALPDGLIAIETQLATLPGGFDLRSDVTLWDDGRPLELTLQWDGSAAVAEGKLPADFILRGPGGVAVTDAGTRSFLSDTDGAFTRNARAGVIALGMLETGRLQVGADSIALTGTAASPQVHVVIDSAFAGIADAVEITRTITYLDDGSPAAWTLRYGATDGATIAGRLPGGLGMQDVADALGLPDIQGRAGAALEDTNTGSSLDVLVIAAGYLPEVETLVYARDGSGSALDLILSPGVDLDLVAVDLAERLPNDVAFSIGPLDALPDENTRRTNAANGLDEVFRQGFWLPDLTFDVDAVGCAAASDDILARDKINFLSSEARLDATSIRGINGLAAVVRPCLEAGLRLEIGGHTDATGSAEANENLSFDRAAQVRAALIDRGAVADLMTPVGYGQTDPIADNATAEGRAANRRTSLRWSNPNPTLAPDADPATDP